MQIALLISNMSVDGAFLDKHDLILLKMLMGWYGCAGGHVFSANEHQMLGAIGFGSDLEDESAGVNLSRLGPPETRLAFILFQQQWVASAWAGCEFAGVADAIRVSFPLTNTFMEFSLSPDSSVYS
jgi:hypothetical protein